MVGSALKTISYSTGLLIDKAGELAGETLQRALRAKDGSLTWTAIRSATPGSTEPVPVGPHLYGGTTGVALFMAAMAKVTGEARYAETAVEILEPLRKRFAALLADPERAAALKLGLGAYYGLGSLAYSFFTVGRLLNRPDLREHAQAMTALATDERIAGDTWYDLMFGGAGWLLVLLAIREASTDEGERARLLAQAAAVGERLAAARASHEGQPAAWYTTPEFPPMTGYSHGAAGIVYALAKLHRITGDAALGAAIEDGLRFERSHFDPERGNWRDLRYPTEQIYGETWCHGAPGIGLGRLAMAFYPDEMLAAEAGIGLETAVKRGRREIDHLCCGNLGRADILLAAAELSGQGAWREEGIKVALQVIDRAERSGYRWMPKSEGEFFDPSFFNGASGAGYTFLRFAAEPGTLPSVLLLE